MFMNADYHLEIVTESTLPDADLVAAAGQTRRQIYTLNVTITFPEDKVLCGKSWYI